MVQVNYFQIVLFLYNFIKGFEWKFYTTVLFNKVMTNSQDYQPVMRKSILFHYVFSGNLNLVKNYFSSFSSKCKDLTYSSYSFTDGEKYLFQFL